MLNFTTYCGVPALCEACHRVVEANILETSPRCSHCGGPIRFYTEADLRGPVPGGTQAVFSWRIEGEPSPISLPDADYLCPQCRQMHMRLEEVGDWD